MTRKLYVIGRWCAEHGWLVIGLWLVAAIVIMGANRNLPGTAKDSFVLSGTDSAYAQDLLKQAFPGSSSEANPLVLNSETEDLGTGVGKQHVTAVVNALDGLNSLVAVVGPSEQPNLLSKDGHSAIISVTPSDKAAGKLGTAEEILTTAEEAAGPTIKVAMGGFLGIQLSKPDTAMSEVFGLLAALLVLFLTMRRFIAMFIPLINAIFAVGIGLAIIGLLGRLVFIPDTAPTLGTMLGLGVGIDYALFLVTRHRKLLTQGFDVPDAVGRTSGTAGAGMVFAGGTLIAAVVGLTFTGITFLAWLGYAAAIVVSLAVLASITLVPALLGVSKMRVVPKSMQGEQDDDETLDKSGWAKLATAVTNRPWIFAITSTVVLLILAAPATTLTLGHTDASSLPPETTARQADDLIAQGFGPGQSAPLAIVVQMYSVAKAPPDPPASAKDPRTADPRLVSLQKTIAGTPGVVSAGSPVVSTDGGVAIIRTTPEWGSANPNTKDLVNTMRDSVLPNATEGKGMTAYVGGVTALITDLSELIAARTAGFIVGVVILAFILLMLAYRSLLIPFKAAVMNLISIAAAYGVVTAVFQWGWGASLIGLDGPVPIESYVPMMMFAVLFGLSMDYEVFLLTAFREHWERTGDMVTSVRRGLADTGRLVTAAALIMVVVFGSFILSSNATVKMFGVGLATAVAVDATIVRCLLVPAIMVLAANGTWWLPAWLDRLLPQVHVEGDPAALDEASLSSHPPNSASRPLVLYKPAHAIGAALGVLLGWLLVTRMPIVPAGSGTAVAFTAVLGGIAVLLPSELGGRNHSRGSRGFGYILGAVIGVGVIGILNMVIPPVQASNGVTTALAIIFVSLIVVIAIGRAMALPLLLGSVAIAICAALLADSAPGAGTLLAVVILPALVAIVVAAIVIGIFGKNSEPGNSDSDAGTVSSGAGDDQEPPSDRGGDPAATAVPFPQPASANEPGPNTPLLVITDQDFQPKLES